MSSSQPPRRFLFGPGPTQVEQRVYDAMGWPVVGILDPYLYQLYDDARRDLRALFGTSNPFTLAIPGTGSSGMEAAVSNFTDPGKKLAVFVKGFFGERIAEMGRRHGANVVRCEKPWGETFSEAEARAFLERERPDVVAFVHAETSTGVLQDMGAISRPARDVGALVIADCVTSLGAAPIQVDANGIDIAYSCSQKGVSAPPGLAPITVSPRAAERIQGRANPVWYLDLNLILNYHDKRVYHHTAPITTWYALREALAAIREEGVEQRFARHAAMHASFVRRMEGLGLKMLVPAGQRIPNLNVVRVPEGVDDAVVRKRLLEEYGIEIMGGFGPLAGKVFRIGIMGPLATEPCLDLFFEAFGACVGSATGA